MQSTFDGAKVAFWFRALVEHIIGLPTGQERTAMLLQVFTLFFEMTLVLNGKTRQSEAHTEVASKASQMLPLDDVQWFTTKAVSSFCTFFNQLKTGKTKSAEILTVCEKWTVGLMARE